MDKRAALGGVLSLILLWQGASIALRSPVLPGPLEVFEAFFTGLPSGLGWHMAVSTWRMGASMFLAVVLGVPIGLALGQSQRLNRIFMPLIYVTYPIPKIVLLPVVLLLLGIGDKSKIFLITLILFYQILVVVRDAAANIPPELVLSVRSLGAKGVQLLRYVYFPACLPATITALRLSTGTAIAVLYIAESFATRAGLGFYIMDTWQSLSYREMYSAVVAMSLIGLAIYMALEGMEGRFCRWVRVGSEKW